MYGCTYMHERMMRMDVEDRRLQRGKGRGLWSKYILNFELIT